MAEDQDPITDSPLPDDADGDGLPDADESELQPQPIDTDEDGILDGEERANGANPDTDAAAASAST